MFASSMAIANSIPLSFAMPDIYTYPEVVMYEVGESFTVDVRIVGAEDIFAWDFKLSWNASLLNFTEIAEGDFLKGFEEAPTFFVNKTYQDEEGVDHIVVACTRLAPDTPGVSGPGTLATATFLVEEEGETVLDLFETQLRDSRITPVEHTSTDGLFTNLLDPPEAAFTYSPAKADIDEDVLFNASDSFDPDGYIVSYFWDFGDEDTANETASQVYHAYDEGGTYSVTLTVTDDSGWNDSVTHEVPIRYPHDVTAISVSESHTTVSVGGTVTVTVEIGNAGSESESNVAVNVYYDDTVAAPSQTVATIASGENRTLTFSWDTTDVAEGTYRIKAVASSVTGETNTADNTELGGTVTVTAAQEFPWLYVIVGIVVVGAIAAVAFFLMRR